MARTVEPRTPRRRKAVSHQTSRGKLLGLGLAGIGSAIGLVAIGVNSPNSIPVRSYYNVNVAFKDADNISIHSQVRVGGRPIGQVLHPRVENGQAVITLQLTPAIKPLRADTRIMVRPRSAIGVRYIEVHPGTSGAPLPDGGRIPASQTGATRPLDEALSTFDPKTRSRAQVLLRQLGSSFAGRGEELNDALGDGGPFVAHLGSAMKAVADRSGATGGFVRGADTAAESVDPVRDEFATGFRPEADVAQTFADERTALHATLAAAPPALRAVDTELARTRPLVREVARFSRGALPVLRSAPPALRSAQDLLDEAGPVLKQTGPTLVAARHAIPTTLKLLRTIRPQLTPLEAGFESSAPILNNLGPRTCDLRNMLGGWGSMMEYGNAAGNYLRFNVEGAAESVQGFQSKIGPLAAVGNPYPAPCEAGTESVGGRR